MTLLVVSLGMGVLWVFLAPFAQRLFRRAAPLVLAALPAGIFLQLCLQIPAIARAAVLQAAWQWAPELGVSLTFRLDGLSLLMALLISGIGALVILYGAAYLEGHPFVGRFYSLTLLFMLSMLGVVLSSNALLLFIFWELTSISSFFLIGFEHSSYKARAAAWQALLVTGMGGLVMLAGLVLLGQISGSFEIHTWLAEATRIAAHPLAPAALVLILVGAGTKSAQFPFHFWLPNAMEAPTPVSAYLHSATMVKAGVYLLARLLPVLSGLALWQVLLVPLGLLTLLGGALLALGQHDLKRLLAYTTVASLGGLVMLLGMATPLAVKSAMLFLLTHALYKGALFLAAGSVDHGAGSRDINILGGVGRAMPLTAAAAGLAALSMAGIPPLLGFLSKELLYESALAFSPALVLTAATLLANAGMVAVAGWVGYQPFWGKPGSGELHPHESSPVLWLPPLLLAALGLLLGILPGITGDWLIAPAALAVMQTAVKVKLSLWHGFTPMLALSALTLLAGFALILFRKPVQAGFARAWHALAPIGPAALYGRGMHAITTFAAWQTRLLQSGYLRVYVLMVAFFTVGMVALSYLLQPFRLTLSAGAVPRFYDVILIGVILIAAVLVTRSTSRLATIAMLGSIGFSIAILFLLYSAPDLAMAQFAIEVLTVILFVLVLYRLPKFSRLSSRAVRLMDVVVAVLGGGLMTMLMLMVSMHNTRSVVAPFFVENSLALAKGRNIVNVILVDFRGFDTLGEITVLAVAAIGVFSLIGLAVRRGKPRRIKKEGE